jgi:hypothetical protein
MQASTSAAGIPVLSMTRLHRGLGERGAPCACAVGGTVAHRVRQAELDQLHPRDRVEDVQAEDPVRVPAAFPELAHGEGGGGAGEVRVADLAEGAEELRLHVQVLLHRLDDEVALGEVIDPRRHPDHAGCGAFDLGGLRFGSLLRPPGRDVAAGPEANLAEHAGARCDATRDRAASGDPWPLVSL